MILRARGLSEVIKGVNIDRLSPKPSKITRSGRRRTSKGDEIESSDVGGNPRICNVLESKCVKQSIQLCDVVLIGQVK